MKEERFPHTRKPLRGQRLWVVEGGASDLGGECSNRGAEGKAEIPARRIGAEQHSPAQEACLLTRQGRWGLGAEARAQSTDPRERTGVGCEKTARRRPLCHS